MTPVDADSRPEIRLAFVDFWGTFDPRNNYFTRLLEPHFRLVQTDDPDYIIYSCTYDRKAPGPRNPEGGVRKKHLLHNCVRIFYTGENMRPEWSACDWAFTFDFDPHPRHYRLPLWAMYTDPATLVKSTEQMAAPPPEQPEFCSFVVSNRLCKTRNRFFEKLSKYKKVNAGGKLFNNVGGPVQDKHAFLARHRFTIAFENSSQPGYTTEKLVEAMLAGTTPIYWGDPLVGCDFDTRSFLSAHDSPTLDDLVERVVAVDRDPDLRRQLFRYPWYRDNRVPACVDPAKVLAQFAKIFNTPILPVARRRYMVRLMVLDRIPAVARSLRRRLVGNYRKMTTHDRV
ncbi:MAG: glycosyltransferase family 10 domain-containing protein [Pirellulales bacterium]